MLSEPVLGFNKPYSDLSCLSLTPSPPSPLRSDFIFIIEDLTRSSRGSSHDLIRQDPHRLHYHAADPIADPNDASPTCSHLSTSPNLRRPEPTWPVRSTSTFSIQIASPRYNQQVDKWPRSDLTRSIRSLLLNNSCSQIYCWTIVAEDH